MNGKRLAWGLGLGAAAFFCWVLLAHPEWLFFRPPVLAPPLLESMASLKDEPLQLEPTGPSDDPKRLPMMELWRVLTDEMPKDPDSSRYLKHMLGAATVQWRILHAANPAIEHELARHPPEFPYTMNLVVRFDSGEDEDRRQGRIRMSLTRRTRLPQDEKLPSRQPPGWHCTGEEAGVAVLLTCNEYLLRKDAGWRLVGLSVSNQGSREDLIERIREQSARMGGRLPLLVKTSPPKTP